MRFSDERQWASSGTDCELAYYNICTGWIWVWAGWDGGERLGAVFDPCCSNALLTSAAIYVWSGAPAGYGFTGTLSIHEADENGCPIGPSIIGGLTLPRSGWETLGAHLPVQSPFVALLELGESSAGSPLALATDHPAAGATGPTACGTCFPSTRIIHSFYYGTADSPLCPGSPLNDGACDVELWWTARMTCNGPLAIESGDWKSIRTLYR